jgi:GTP-binding protein
MNTQKDQANLPLIAIIGRPNVGKSTLFNRIVGWKNAIVDDRPGVTRDRNMCQAQWLDHNFIIMDTGGIEIESDEPMSSKVKTQVLIGIEMADLIIFMCDAKTGLHAEDSNIADLLRKHKIPVILAINKADSDNLELNSYEFFKLSLGEPFSFSAEHGRGIGDFLDELVQRLPQKAQENLDCTKISFIGKPNVGKSTLLNKLCGQERSIVDEQPGTTRDSVDTLLTLNEKEYLIIDTAGVRRKSKVYDNVEKYAVLRSIQAVDRSDVVLMIIDIAEGISDQDRKIAGIAKRKGKGLIIVVNKIDRVKKGGDLSDELTSDQGHYVDRIKKEFAAYSYAPVVFISAENGKNLDNLMKTIDLVVEERGKKIQTSIFNDFIKNITYYHQPPSKKGVRLKIYYATQVQAGAPSFVLFVNQSHLLHFSYRRYIENAIRDEFGFTGNPIRIVAREDNTK